MTIFLVLIRPIDQATLVLIRYMYLGVIAGYSDLKDIVDTWNKKG